MQFNNILSITRSIVAISVLSLCGCASSLPPTASQSTTFNETSANPQSAYESPAHHRANLLINDSGAAISEREYSKAQKLAEEATSIDPQFPEAWFCYGVASVHLGQSERARTAYERMLSLYQILHRQNPSDSKLVLSEISSLILLDRSAEAQALLERARIDYPGDKQFTNADRLTQLQQDEADCVVKAE